MNLDPVAISFTLYTLGIIALGLYSARFARNTDSDFFLARRGLGAWVAALSSSASAESGWVTLGLVGMAYNTGVGALWIVLGTFIAFLFNWFILAWRQPDVPQPLTSLHYYEKCYLLAGSGSAVPASVEMPHGANAELNYDCLVYWMVRAVRREAGVITQVYPAQIYGAFINVPQSAQHLLIDAMGDEGMEFDIFADTGGSGGPPAGVPEGGGDAGSCLGGGRDDPPR